jgi:2-oxoglutarate dehydrogenase E2 component (dihydrolipoamide succinyltransferase)
VLEFGLDPSKIKGTGKDGRLNKDDVLNARPQPARARGASRTASAPPPLLRLPAPASAPGRPRRSPRGARPHDRLRKTIASRLKEAQNPRRCSPPSTTST